MRDEEYVGALLAYVTHKQHLLYKKPGANKELVGVDACLQSIGNYYKRNGFLTQRQLEYIRPKLTSARIRGLRWTAVTLKPPAQHRIVGRYAYLEGRRKIALRMQDEDAVPEIKKMTEALYDRRKREWTVSLELMNVLQLKGMDFTLDKSIKAWLEQVMPSGDASDEIVNIPGLNAELRDYQRYAVSFFETRGGRVILADEMGLGKAQPLSSHVLTPFGFKRMGLIKKDDYVIGRDGKRTRVLDVFPQGNKQVYKVTFSDGTSTRCCKDHLWEVFSPNDKWKGRPNSVMRLADMIGKVKQKNGNRNFYLPLNDPVEFETHTERNIDPYLLGLLLGDGGVSCNCVNVTNHDTDFIASIAQYLPHNTRIAPTGDGMTYRLAIADRSLAKQNPIMSELRRISLAGKLSKEKHIPRDYLYAPIKDRIALLQGLMDTDGFVVGNDYAGYATSSKRLMWDMCFLVRSLGGIAVVRTREAKLNGKSYGTHYRIAVKIGNNIPLFRHSYKKGLYVGRTKYQPFKAIDSIEPDGVEECQCILVENAEHLYITDGFTVTHNTIQTIAYLLKSGSWPAVVVCPSAVKYNWMDEMKKRAPDRVCAVIEGGYDGVTLPDADMYIINYDILAPRKGKTDGSGGWATVLSKLRPAIVIFDEIHKVKNTKTKRFKASKIIAKKAEKVVGLSGTIIENRPIEAFAACHLVSPKLFPSFTEYKHRYCDPQKGAYGTSYVGASNTAELHQKLTSTIMLRRRKEEVLKDLPPKTRIAVPLRVDLREYNRVEADTMMWLRSNKGSWRDKKTRMNALARIEALKQAAAKAKMGTCIQWIEDYLDDGDGKIAVFGHHISVLQQLYAPFAKEAIYIDGSVSAKERFRLAEVFNTKPKIRVAVGGIEPMGTGLNMQGGMATAFVEFAWKPGLHDQAEDRVHRMTTTWPVTAYYLTAMGTIDVYIANMIDKKRAVVAQVVDGKDPEDSDMLIELLKMYEKKAA